VAARLLVATGQEADDQQRRKLDSPHRGEHARAILRPGTPEARARRRDERRSKN
jgi:hypothetical protein